MIIAMLMVIVMVMAMATVMATIATMATMKLPRWNLSPFSHRDSNTHIYMPREIHPCPELSNMIASLTRDRSSNNNIGQFIPQPTTTIAVAIATRKGATTVIQTTFKID
jgi:hypothetical protein